MSPTSPCAIAAPSAAASRWPIRRPRCRPACWRSARRSCCKAPPAGARSRRDDYFKGLYETARRPDELLVEALIPVQRPPPSRCSWSWPAATAISPSPAWRSICRSTGHRDRRAPRLFRQRGQADAGAAARARAIMGKPLDAADADAAAAAALEHDLAPMSNPQGSAKMRLHLQRVLTRRALGHGSASERGQHERGNAADQR